MKPTEFPSRETWRLKLATKMENLFKMSFIFQHIQFNFFLQSPMQSTRQSAQRGIKVLKYQFDILTYPLTSVLKYVFLKQKKKKKLDKSHTVFKKRLNHVQ